MSTTYKASLFYGIAIKENELFKIKIEKLNECPYCETVSVGGSYCHMCGTALERDVEISPYKITRNRFELDDYDFDWIFDSSSGQYIIGKELGATETVTTVDISETFMALFKKELDHYGFKELEHNFQLWLIQDVI